jgi:hypothetical protein
MRRTFPTLLILLATLLLGSCQWQEKSDAATPVNPSATPAQPTLLPTQAQNDPTATLPPLNPITATPSLSFTATPQDQPFPSLTPTLNFERIALRIVTPGPMSRIVSPLQFIAHIDPYYTGTTRIELLGEDGRELYRKVFKTTSNIGYFTRVEEKINFEISAAAEVARLQISTYDPEGNLQAFNSVRLLLLSVGENQLTPAYEAKERIALRYPQAGQEVSGGELIVTGEYKPINQTPLILELYNARGIIVGSRLLQIPPGGDVYEPFTASLPYEVREATPVRLTLRQADDRISGMAYLYSIPLTLLP